VGTGRCSAQCKKQSAKRSQQRLRLTNSLFVARGLFFPCQLVVPSIVAQAQLAWQRFGFADTDFTAIFQEFLNKRVIRRFFWDMFHNDMLTFKSACLSRTFPMFQLLFATLGQGDLDKSYHCR
jgi:hypothetical protein